MSLSQDLLLSSSDESDSELSETEKIQIMLELQYKRRKKWRKRLKKERKVFCVALYKLKRSELDLCDSFPGTSISVLACCLPMTPIPITPKS